MVFGPGRLLSTTLLLAFEHCNGVGSFCLSLTSRSGCCPELVDLSDAEGSLQQERVKHFRNRLPSDWQLCHLSAAVEAHSGRPLTGSSLWHNHQGSTEQGGCALCCSLGTSGKKRSTRPTGDCSRVTTPRPGKDTFLRHIPSLQWGHLFFKFRIL